jgi:hypothetical protein
LPGASSSRPSAPIVIPATTYRHPGQAKREPGSQKNQRRDLLRSRIRLRLSGTANMEHPSSPAAGRINHARLAGAANETAHLPNRPFYGIIIP